MLAGNNLALTAADLNKEVEDVLAHYRRYKVDGWTVTEVYEFITRATGSLVRLVGEYDPSHDDLKATVLAAIGKLYDDVLAPIDIPYVPNIIETRFLDPAIRSALLKQVSGMIDGLLKIFADPPAVPPGAPAVTPAAPPATPTDWRPY